MQRLDQILKDLGLDEGMAAVFEFIADKKRATLDQVYEGTRLSRKAILLAAEALEAKGALTREGPYLLIESLPRSLNTMAPARFEEIRAEIDSYQPENAQIEWCPIVEIAPASVADLRLFMAREITSAAESVDTISHMLEWLGDETLDALEAAIQRGVIVRILTYEHPGFEADARALREAGAEVRTGEYATKIQLIIIDGMSMALDLPAPPRGTRYPSIRLRDLEACQRLEEVFGLAWNDAEII